MWVNGKRNVHVFLEYNSQKKDLSLLPSIPPLNKINKGEMYRDSASLSASKKKKKQVLSPMYQS